MKSDEYIANEEYHARLNRIRKAEAEGVSAVGIFWILPDMKIEFFSLPYTEGFDEGEYITAQIKHATYWKSHKRGIQQLITIMQLSDGLNEFAYEYDYFPRGRVEYCKSTETFIIYGPDRVVNNAKAIELIKSTFHLKDQVIELIKDLAYEDYSDKLIV